jgi:hypothetical protein
MSQNDMVIADAPGATARADINSALQALASTSKGAAAPSTPYAGQLWLEDDNPSSTVWTLWQYDGADWVKLGEVDSANNRFNVMTNQSADVASATTLNLDTAYGMVTDVTGTTTITAVTLAQGKVRIVRFTGALTFTHGASLVLPGGANITTAAGDYAILVGYASGVVRCVSYTRAAEAPYTPGTFTPVLTFATPGNLSVTYDTQAGFYTKNGREVTLSIALDTATFTHTTASGALTITGLPFTALGTSGYRATGGVVWTGITKANYTEVKAVIEAGQVVMILQASGSAQVVSNVAAADMPTTGNVQLFITITYFAA